MADYQQSVYRSDSAVGIDAGLRAHMSRVYMLMAGAMVITGVVAFLIGNSPALLATLFGSPLKWVVMLAPLAMVFFLSMRIHKMSEVTAQAVFWVYAAMVGASISFIFAVYTGSSIAQTFFVTAVAFLGLSLYGYTTKTDLSGLGRFLIMGVIGLVVAMIVNWFLGSSTLEMAISALGVLIFAALTAYDTQSIKNEYLMLAQEGAEGQSFMGRAAIMGALRLYLNFLNMFLFLLSFLGSSQE